MTRTLVAALALFIIATSSHALVLCTSSRGTETIRIRNVCSKNELQLDPVALGLQGPKGDPGINPIPCASQIGNEVYFEECNVNIRNGSGATDGVLNGLGNLVIGYNEDLNNHSVRTGSHNIVVGSNHSYSSFGGLVSGAWNTVSGPASSVIGGYQNIASGCASSITGGNGNLAQGCYSSVSGGHERSVYETSNWAAGNLFEPN